MGGIVEWAAISAFLLFDFPLAPGPPLPREMILFYLTGAFPLAVYGLFSYFLTD
jgi:hypothetical protein